MIYLLLLTALISLSIFYDSARIKSVKYNTWLWVVVISLIAIAWLRYKIGADTAYSYMLTYEDYPSIDKLHFSDLLEYTYQPGWIFFNTLCKYIDSSFYTFQFVHALILNLSILFFLRHKTEYLFTSLLAYYTLNYLEFNTECLRESMAISFALIAFVFYERKKYIVVVVLGFIAFNFHVSAIGALLLPIIAKLNLSKRNFYILFIILLISPFIYRIIPDQTRLILSYTGSEDLAGYYNSEFSTVLNTNFYIQHVFYHVLIPMYLIRYNSKYCNGKFIGYAYVYSILQILAMFSYAFYRLSNYIAPFYWIFIADCAMVYLKLNNTSYRKVLYVIFVGIWLFISQGRLLGKDSDPRLKSNAKIYERYFPYKTWINE